MTDQTLNNLGQDYFKAGQLIVGDVEYANYRTTGVNDQVVLQAAIDAATANSGIKEIRIVTSLSLSANPAYNEVIGGSTRRIAVRLRDNVKIIISAGCTISFRSGGNSGTTFTAAFGNFGNLSGCSIVCEGKNAFDGLSTTAGIAGQRFGAVDIDCRSNSCTTVTNNEFIVSGRRTAGRLVKMYNSNGAGVTIARNSTINVLNADICLGAAFIERGGESLDITVSETVNSLGDAVEIKDGVRKSKLTVDSITGSVLHGVKIVTDTSITTTFNELDINILNIESSGEHNLYIQGLNGTVKVKSLRAQKSGIFFDEVVSGGNNLYPRQLIFTDLISTDNNQSGGQHSGVAGIIRNTDILSFDCSDTQNTPTQYRGINLIDAKCDYISLRAGQARNNVNSQVVLTGVNSFVGKDVMNWSNQYEGAGSSSHTISSPVEIYLLSNNDTVFLPKWSSIDATLPRRYSISCTTGSARVRTTQEDDTTYRNIGTYGGNAGITISAGQRVEIVKAGARWELLGDVTSNIVTINSLTSSAGTTITNTTLFNQVDTSDGSWSKTLPLAGEVIGKTFEFYKVTRDFNIATFNVSGSDRIQSFGKPASPIANATSVFVILPNESLKLTAVSLGVWRAQYVRDLSYMRSLAYRTTTQSINGSSNAVFQWDTMYGTDIVSGQAVGAIELINPAFGLDRTSFAFVAPVTGIYNVRMSVPVATTNPSQNPCDGWFEYATAAAPTTFTPVSYSPIVRPSSTSGLEEQIFSTRYLTINRGDRVRASIRNGGSAIISTTLPANVLAIDPALNRPPARTFFAAALEECLY